MLSNAAFSVDQRDSSSSTVARQYLRLVWVYLRDRAQAVVADRRFIENPVK